MTIEKGIDTWNKASWTAEITTGAVLVKITESDGHQFHLTFSHYQLRLSNGRYVLEAQS